MGKRFLKSRKQKRKNKPTAAVYSLTARAGDLLRVLPSWWRRHQRLQSLYQFRQPILLGDDRIEPGCGRLPVSQVHRTEADDLDMGQLRAQERRGFHAIGYRFPEVKKYQVAAGFHRFLDRGRGIVNRPAHFVRGCDFDEISNSTAHGGTVVHNKESGLARSGHKREKLLRFLAKDNTEMRIFSYRGVAFIKTCRVAGAWEDRKQKAESRKDNLTADSLQLTAEAVIFRAASTARAASPQPNSTAASEP